MLVLSRQLCESLAFSPDGLWLAGGIWDNTVRAENAATVTVWDASTYEEVQTLRGHTNSVLSVAFSPDGKRIISGSQDRSVKIWDVPTGEATLTCQHHDHKVQGVAFLPDGKHALSSAKDVTLQWDATTGRLTPKIEEHVSRYFESVQSPDGQLVATRDGSNSVTIQDVVTEKVQTFGGFKGSILCISFSSDGDRLIAGSWDGTVKMWDVATGNLMHDYDLDLVFVTALAVSPDGFRVAVGGSEGVVLIDLDDE